MVSRREIGSPMGGLVSKGKVSYLKATCSRFQPGEGPSRKTDCAAPIFCENSDNWH